MVVFWGDVAQIKQALGCSNGIQKDSLAAASVHTSGRDVSGSTDRSPSSLMGVLCTCATCKGDLLASLGAPAVFPDLPPAN